MASVDVNDHGTPDDDAEEMSAADIDGAFVPRHRPNTAGVELDGEMVLLVEGTTKPHWLNQTGTIVWNCLDGMVSLDELAGEIAEAFGADPSVVRDDVIDIAQGLGGAGLLEGVAEEVPKPPQYEPPSLPLGDELPSFDGPGLNGDTVRSEDLRGHKLLLINWSAMCGFCKKIAPDLAELQPELKANGVELVLLTYGTSEDNRELLDESGIDCTVVFQEGASEVFGTAGTPSAYLVDADGKVASKMVVGALEVPTLARSAAGRDEPES
ncbi:MAG: PqqD family peptide modification chaperone [Actinomycetota bacterium]